MISLHPDLYALVDGSLFSASEVKRGLGDKNPAWRLSRVGQALRLELRRYPVWMMLDAAGGNARIGVSEELAGHVDGLCGYMDGLAIDDQQTPDGEVAKSTAEFGDSWRVLDSAECRLQVSILIGKNSKFSNLCILFINSRE